MHTYPVYSLHVIFLQPFCFPDKAIRRDVDNLEVQCCNSKLGCQWVGQLRQYFEVHVYIVSIIDITRVTELTGDYCKTYCLNADS